MALTTVKLTGCYFRYYRKGRNDCGPFRLASSLRFIRHRTSQGRWVMVIESGFFYIVLITLLMVILNVLLTKSQRRHDRHSTV
jgi:hypothetical protein